MRSQSSSSERFLRRVRNRLWARELLDIAARAGWAGAALLVVAGGVHVTLRASSGTVAVAAAAGLVALALGFGLLARRPGLAPAARSADRWFAGESLMTSALDQLERPPAERAGAAGFVLASADRAAAEWQARLRRVAPLHPARHLVVPLLLAGVGGFLHLLPGAGPAEIAPASAAELGAAARLPDRATGGEDAGALLAWRRSGVERDRSDAPDAPREGSIATAAARGAADEPSAEEGPPPPGAKTTPRAPLAAPAALGEAAAGRSGSSRARPGEFLGPGAPVKIEVRYLAIERPAGEAAGGSSGTPLRAHSPGEMSPAEASQVGSRSGPVLARAALAPAVRRYVADFTNEIREQP